MLTTSFQPPGLSNRTRLVLRAVWLFWLCLVSPCVRAEEFIYSIYGGFGVWDTRIERFDSNGSAEVFADTFTVRGPNESGLPDPPQELAVDALGNVWVSTAAHAILRYRPNGVGSIFAAPGEGGGAVLLLMLQVSFMQ